MQNAETYVLLAPEQRQKALAEALAESSNALVRAAEIFAAMEAEGDDISRIPAGLRRALRAIAARTMLPEVWTKFDGQVRARVMRLPLERQKDIISGKPLPVYSGDKVELKTVDVMSPREAMLVFDGEGHIRTPDEQMMESAAAPVRRRKIIVTTRHPRSKHGLPVVLVDGKLMDSWQGLQTALEEIGMSVPAFAERCGITPSALYVRAKEGLTAAQLNVLRDLTEDFELA